MAVEKYICPPQPPAGSGTFSNNLVGFQLVQGGGLTQGNFDFTTSITEKSNRNFDTGVFSNPISLETLNVSLEESKLIIAKNFQVYPNIDLAQVGNFTLYGPLNKRFEASIQHILNYFPAALEVNALKPNFISGYTATNIIYDYLSNLVTFDINCEDILNPFLIDYTNNSTLNLQSREIKVSDLRNFTTQYENYVLIINDVQYEIIDIEATTTLTAGTLTITAIGNAFNNQLNTYDYLIIRPNDEAVNRIFNLDLDYVDNFLLNRNTVPIYTTSIDVPVEQDDGSFITIQNRITWPLNGKWNLDIITNSFTIYLEKLNAIAEDFDSYKTNLITRFLITDSLVEFDTNGQKVDKVLKIYGRSFDDTKVFIDTLANMTSVNYNIGNDIPSQLLKNLAQTLGWNTNISPISTDKFLDTIFSRNETPLFDGLSVNPTPDELNYQYFRNLIMNSAYLFKSKGTRKSIENLLRLIGAPEALVEFNETVYVANNKINFEQFETKYALISAGTYNLSSIVWDPNTTYSLKGIKYTAYTSVTEVISVDTVRNDYPVDNQGYPIMPQVSENYYFQKGAGWFEITPEHRSREILNETGSVFTGQSPSIQTTLAPFTYGQPYLDRYIDFPYLNVGFDLTITKDNKKSWTDTDQIRNSFDAGFTSNYSSEDDRLVINVKNIDLYLNPGQGLLYDVWWMSQQYNYPIPSDGIPDFYTSQFTQYFKSGPCNSNQNLGISGVNYCGFYFDETIIDPQPQTKTFFEFAQDFIKNIINVRDRLWITDGKTGGYPKLQSIFWQYLLSDQTVNIPTNNFSYDKMIQFVEGIGDYWIRLIEQMVPATTIWNTGVKLENSSFHRQKFVYRRQRGCEIIPLPCEPCQVSGPIFTYDCSQSTLSCEIFPWNAGLTSTNSFAEVLTVTLNNYLTNNGYTIGQCNTSSMVTEWFVDLKLNGATIIQNSFYTGYGIGDYPSAQNWFSALNNYLPQLNDYGLGYFISNQVLNVRNLDCEESFYGQSISLNVGINIQIVCNG